ncbi:MAG: PQQ-like beta-propeller repeat protein [Phycisphaerae bacterium]|nr:PQQ-like beta-propeller repeat protein [Phycisphaerae bacterium]
MKIKSVILPGVVAVVLLASVAYWIYEYKQFTVEPRVAGQDNRPLPDPQDAATQKPEGRLQTFREVAFAAPTPRPKPPASWRGFRGPDYNAVVQSEVPLAKQFGPEGPTKLWQVELGQGYAAPVVHDDRVYIIDYDMENQRDAIRCLSLADGAEIWRYSYPVKIKRNHGMSRTIPAIDGKYMVTIGPKCHVTCLDITTGEFKWMIDLVAEYGTKEPLWYAGQCPLIVEGKAILAPAGPEVLMMAVDCETGEVAWKTLNPKKWEMTHCSILPMEFAGHDFYVYPGSGGVAGVSAKDGTLLWQTDAWFLRVNVPTPVDCGDGKIFLCAGYNKGSMMLQLEQKDGKIVPKVLYELLPETFGSDQQTPIFYNGHIYGVRPDKQMVCMDLDGNILWTSGTENKYGLGPYIIVNEMIYILDDDSVLSLIEATPEKFNKTAQVKVLDGHESWGPPVLIEGKLLVRDLTTMACLDVTQ